MRTVALVVGCLPLAASSASAPQEAAWDAVAGIEWDARAVEHLLNRAGFGARPGTVERWVARDPAALVEHLLAPPALEEPPVVPRIPLDKDRLRNLPREERRARISQIKAQNREAVRAYAVGWVERMLAGEQPLTERMTLFWHGVFTTQASKVKLAHELIGQNLLLREHALGSYGRLLRAVLRDPAMLVYLDNAESEASHPNENLARELLELFSLGEGHYGEEDVHDVARALTGHGADRSKGYRFDPKRHDYGTKAVLGVAGPLDLDDVVDAILEHPQCARWVAGRILTYFEGVVPAPERLERYATLLRDADYEIEPFLRTLFLDPDFYRPAVVGARIASPIDYLVGSARRAGIDPPAAAILVGGTILGEQLFEPPSVRGWEGGEAWITTASLMDRASLAGMLLGVVGTDDLRAQDPLLEALAREERVHPKEGADADEEGVSTADVDELLGDIGEIGEMQMDALAMDYASEAMMEGDGEGRRAVATPLLRVARVLEMTGYAPRINLVARLQRRGAASDRAIVDVLLDELLAIEAPDATREELVRRLRRERRKRSIEPGELLEEGERAERILRRLAHGILSLPEAQLQ